MHSGNADAAEMLRAMRSFLHDNDMMAYLAMMAVRLIELHRVLKPTGSLYLHCDPTASHYLKILLDAVFGPNCYRSEISWKRSSAHSDAKQGRKVYGNIRDIIYFYSKSESWTWNWQFTPYDQKYVEEFYRHIDPMSGRRFRVDNLTAAKPGGDVSYPWRIKRCVAGGDWQGDLTDEFKSPKDDWEYSEAFPYKGRFWAYSRNNMIAMEKEGRIYYTKGGMPNYKRYLDEMPGVPLQNDWQDIPPALGEQDMGYPTQKPVALLERIIRSSSNEGDVVLDPFCGCGTTVHAAQRLNRNWVGIDVTHLAISLIQKRLRDAFGPIPIEIHGTPKDVDGGRALAEQDKYQFQWWAVSLVDAVPYGGKKKGADSGIDGFIYFKPDGKTTEKAIVSVKGGENVSVPMVRELANVVEREKAKIGVLITLADPTGPMKKEAIAAGFYKTEYGEYPKIQILTVEQLFAGDKPDMPWIDSTVFKKAKREMKGSQGKLL